MGRNPRRFGWKEPGFVRTFRGVKDDGGMK